VDLRRLIAFVRTWFPLLLAAALLAGAAGYLVGSLQPKVYEAKATLIVGQSLSAVNPDYTQLMVSQTLAETYASVAKTRPILNQVIEKLGLDATNGDVAARVNVDTLPNSPMLTVSADGADPAGAAALANAVATELIAATPTIQGREGALQKSIDAQLEATQAQIATAEARVQTLSEQAERTAKEDAELQALEGRLVSLRSTYATLIGYSTSGASNLITVVEPAAASSEPVAPKPLLNMLLAAVLGLLVVGTIAFAIDLLDDSIKDAGAVFAVTQLSTLGTIPRFRGDNQRSAIYSLVTLLYPRSGDAEAYRKLRTNVDFASVDAPIRTLLVSSSVPGEGKSVICANLAVVMAQADRSVLLVDADLRMPGAHKIFDVPNTVGLTTLLRPDAGMNFDNVVQATEQANLRILTTGPLPANPAELLGSQRMRALLETLTTAADLVVIDSPPLEAVADAAVLSSFVDGTLLVVDASRGRRRVVRNACEALARAGANVLGVVLNRVPSGPQADYYGYHASDKSTTKTVVTGAMVDAPVELASGSPRQPGNR
jgi:polysaccharide biosynthesis transport protein